MGHHYTTDLNPNAICFSGKSFKKELPPRCRTNLPRKKWKGNLKETSPQGWLNCFCLPTASFFQVDHHPQLLQISWLLNLSPPQYVPPRRHSRPYEDENPKPLVSNNKALLLNPYEFLKGVGFQPPSFSTRNGNLKSRCILPLRMDVLSLSGKGRGRVVFCCVVFFPTFRGRKRRGGEFLGWETKKSSKIFGVVLFFNGQKWNHYRVGGD